MTKKHFNFAALRCSNSIIKVFLALIEYIVHHEEGVHPPRSLFSRVLRFLVRVLLSYLKADDTR
jgi:hypothetical protein